MAPNVKVMFDKLAVPETSQEDVCWAYKQPCVYESYGLHYFADFYILNRL